MECHLASGHPRTIDCPSHADTARQSTGIKQRIDPIVAPRDTPDATASDNQRPWHAVACSIATALHGASGGSGGAHERAGADASAPGPACARGRCEPGIQCRCLGAEGPGCSDQGGREEAVDGIQVDEEDGEWWVELVSAVVEALAGKEESEDVGELYFFALAR